MKCFLCGNDLEDGEQWQYFAFFDRLERGCGICIESFVRREKERLQSLIDDLHKQCGPLAPGWMRTITVPEVR